MKIQEYAIPLLRYALALLFVTFGIEQLARPDYWIGYLPSWAAGLPAETLILMNGTLDLLLGLLLALGIGTRIVAGIAFLHMAGTAASLGYNDVAIRDWALSLTALALALHGPDCWSLERYRKVRQVL